MVSRVFGLALLGTGMIVWFALSEAAEAKPTLSLEASGVNFVPLADGPVAEVSVLPGDRVTAEIRLRDWSPEGEKLIAYQVQLEPTGFSSGPKGFIEPVLMGEATRREFANEINAFVDKSRPDYVYKDMHAIALVDSRSEDGYRWMGVMNSGEGPVCPDPARKFYGGTVHFMVSENAAGTFTLGFKEGEDFTTLLKPPGPRIEGLELEALKVNVLTPTDVGFWPQMIERLNSHWFKTAQPPEHDLQDKRTPPQLSRFVNQLNESARKPQKTEKASE